MKKKLVCLAVCVLLMALGCGYMAAYAQEISVDVRALHYADGQWYSVPTQAECEVTGSDGAVVAASANSGVAVQVNGAYTVRVVSLPEGLSVPETPGSFDANVTVAVVYVYANEGVVDISGAPGTLIALSDGDYALQGETDAQGALRFYRVPVGECVVRELRAPNGARFTGESVTLAVPVFMGGDDQIAHADFSASPLPDDRALKVSLSGGSMDSLAVGPQSVDCALSVQYLENDEAALSVQLSVPELRDAADSPAGGVSAYTAIENTGDGVISYRANDVSGTVQPGERAAISAASLSLSADNAMDARVTITSQSAPLARGLAVTAQAGFDASVLTGAGETKTVSGQAKADTVCVVSDGRALFSAGAAIQGNQMTVTLEVTEGALADTRAYIVLPDGWLIESARSTATVQTDAGDALAFTGGAMRRGDSVQITAALSRIGAPGDIILYVYDACNLGATADNPQGYTLAGDAREANGYADIALDTLGGQYALTRCEARGEATGGAAARPTIGGEAYEDVNASGRRELDEAGLEGVYVIRRASGALAIAVTDTAGRYTLPVGEGTLEGVGAAGYELIAVNGNNLSYEKRGDVTLSARDGSGMPLANVRLELAAPDGEVTEAVTGEDGKAHFTGLRAGAYTISLTDENFARISGETACDVLYGGHADMAWVCAKTGKLTGVVTNMPDDTRLELQSGTAVMVLTPDADGNFSMWPMMPGTYSVSLVLPVGWVADETNAASLTWTSGEEHVLSLGVRRAGAITGVSQAGAVRAYRNGVLCAEAAQGIYVMDQLHPGEYELRAVLPEGASVSGEWTVRGGDVCARVTVLEGETTVAPDLAMLLPASVTGYVWADDGDGYYHQDDRLLSGATVILTRVVNGAGEDVGRVRSDRDGAFAFSDVTPGNYMITVTLPDSNTFVMRRAGGSVIRPTTGRTGASDVFTLASGEARSLPVGCADAAAFQLAAFVDENVTGTRSTYEPALSGTQCVVYMVDELDGLCEIKRVKTGNSGTVRIEWMPTGELVLEFILPDGYIIGPMGDRINENNNCVPAVDDTSAGRTEPFQITPGRVSTAAVGAVKTAQLSGMVWVDGDFDGVQRAQDAGLAGVTVTLTGAQNGAAYETVTDSNGAYSIDHLRPQEYAVSLSFPQGYISADVSTAPALTMGFGETRRANNIGARREAALNLYAFSDDNANGMIDDGETALPGVAFDVSGGGTAVTVLTDERGNARVDGMRGGSVTVRAVLPEGLCFGMAGDNAFAPDTAQREATLTLALDAGTEGAISAGATYATGITGRVYLDSDYSGTQNGGEAGLAGVVVSAVRAADGKAVSQTVTDAAGAFSMAALVPGTYSLSLQFDSGFTATCAGDGNDALRVKAGEASVTGVRALPGAVSGGWCAGLIQSGSIHGALRAQIGGVNGARVTLESDEETVTVYTGVDGVWTADGLTPGRYQVTLFVPDGFMLTQPETDARLLVMNTVTLAMGGNEFGGEAVAQTSASVACQVNGTSGGVKNARLLLESDSLGYRYDITSEEDGALTLANVRPGDYDMTLTLPEGMLLAGGDGFSAAPVGTAVKTLALAGGDALSLRADAAYAASLQGTVWLDDNDNGAWDENERALAGAVVTVSGNAQAALTLRTDENGAFAAAALLPGEYAVALQYPEGYVPSGALPETQTVTPNEREQVSAALGTIRLAKIAGRVWNLDGTDAPPAGVSVTLLGASGDTVARADMTDGVYAFSGLRPGEYTLVLETPQGTLYPRKADLDGRVSLLMNGDGNRAAVTLPMGEDQLSCDFGVGLPGKLGDTAWIDLDADGSQDADEPGLPGLTVTLAQHGEWVAEAVTDTYGHYLFTKLYPGEYTLSVFVPDTLRTTLVQPELIMLTSVLPEGLQGEVSAQGVRVPSNGANLNADLGFALTQRGVYPDGFATPAPLNWESGLHE